MKKTAKINIALLIIGILVLVPFLYTSFYYHADSSVREILNDPANTIETYKNHVCVLSDNSEVGFIFYPGGKVAYTAYIPLLKELADKGINCYIVKMPLNLAVFKINAASNIIESHPEINKWYIGGHSLGGAMASTYASSYSDSLEGLILLGAYASSDLTKTDLDVLLIYGTNDLVLNKESYNNNLINLPEDYVEHQIEGGCHAYFGKYGEQKGDGIPTISQEEQISITANLISDFIFNYSIKNQQVKYEQ